MTWVHNSINVSPTTGCLQQWGGLQEGLQGGWGFLRGLQDMKIRSLWFWSKDRWSKNIKTIQIMSFKLRYYLKHILSTAIVPRYNKRGNSLCRIVLNTPLFICKISVPVKSLGCQYRIWASTIEISNNVRTSMWPRKKCVPGSGPFLRQGHHIDFIMCKGNIHIHHQWSVTECRKVILFECNPT